MVPAEDTALLIDKAQRNEVNIKVSLEEQVCAPVSKGQRLGTLTVTVGQQVLAEIPMVAEDAVQKMSLWDIFCRLLRRCVMAKEA